MKFLLSLLLFSFTSVSVCFSQEKSVTVVRSSKGMFIETESYSNETSLRLGPTAANQLIQGMKKAKVWSTTNQQYKKEFQKEIVRFWVMDKGTFQFHGYIQQLANTAKLIFIGSSDGTSSCLIRIDGSFMVSDFLELKSYSEMNSFLKILEGKSANKEIDSIFK